MATTKTKLKFHKEQAGDVESIRDDLKGGYGNMLWIGPNKSRVFRILCEPREFTKYHYVRNEALGVKGKLPTFDGYEEYLDGPGNVQLAHVMPIATVDAETGELDGKVMWYEPPKGVLGDLLKHFDRRKTITDRDFEVMREGSGQKSTKYTLMSDDAMKRPEIDGLEISDFDDELERMVNEYLTAQKVGSKGGTRTVVSEEPQQGRRRRAMQEEPAEEEESAPAPSRRRQAAPEPDPEPVAESEGASEPYDEWTQADLVAEVEERGLKVEGRKTKIKLVKLLEDDDAGSDGGAEPEPEGADEEPAEGGAAGDDLLTATFTVDSTDPKVSYTANLVADDGTEYPDAYFDRQIHDLKALEVGARIKVTLEMDSDGDWIVQGPIQPGKKPK